MSVLMFGYTGQVARALQDRAAACGVALTALPRAAVDLADASAVERAIAQAPPDTGLVVNAAAFAKVDDAEAEPGQAFAVNAAAPGAMARACAARGLPFAHISTDNVFDGSGTAPWREDDLPAPVNTYGRSKRAGEEAVLAAGGRALVVRTSWVFSAYGANFVQIMLGLADRPQVRVVDDQFGSPTPARALADFLLSLEGRLNGPEADRLKGVVHFAGDRPVSRLDFARAVFAAAGLQPNLVAVPSSGFPTPAERPKNGALDVSRLSEVFGVRAPDWRPALAEAVAELQQGVSRP